jgi:cytochrome b involved in lipid metabolism
MKSARPLMARISVVAAIPLSMAIGLALAPVARAVQPVVAPVVVPAVVATPAVAPAAVAAALSYNAAAVAAHGTAANCWLILSGNVYDLTVWAPTHPGGVGEITKYCGKDGTTAFTKQHTSLTAATKNNAAKTYGGVLAPSVAGTYDNLAPTAPTGLIATAGNAQVTLSWTGPADAVSYQVLRNNVSVATSATASYTDTNLANGTPIAYTVMAVDAAGNISAASTAVSATPVAPVTIPATPTGLVATAGNTQVVLSWTASPGQPGSPTPPSRPQRCSRPRQRP